MASYRWWAAIAAELRPRSARESQQKEIGRELEEVGVPNPTDEASRGSLDRETFSATAGR